ncbi:MAG: hypothetical protein U1A25_01695 [Candidatus Sungbacteria bacterium]|nr:hypothetical protein [bacterium]MDZ4260354.1 hypothetical protein [Candidatus Sungbacteria bacterium]
MLQKILETDFSAENVASMLENISDIVNRTCEHFIITVLLMHPLMTEIFSRFKTVCSEGITVVESPPIVMFIPQSPEKNTREPHREGEGFYL